MGRKQLLIFATIFFLPVFFCNTSRSQFLQLLSLLVFNSKTVLVAVEVFYILACIYYCDITNIGVVLHLAAALIALTWQISNSWH